MSKSKLITLIGAAIVSTMLSCTEPEKTKEPFQGEFSPIENFKDDISLIACYDNLEYQGVMQSLRQRNNLRQDKFKFTFTPRDNYMKVTVPNRDENNKIKNSYIHIAKKENLDDLQTKMNNLNIKYDIVQLRGHQFEPMEELYKKTERLTKENSIFLFGGCNSYELAQEYSTQNKPAIGGEGMQETSRNTFYLLKLIDLMKTENVKTWTDLYNEMNSSDREFKNFYMPGKN